MPRLIECAVAQARNLAELLVQLIRIMEALFDGPGVPL